MKQIGICFCVAGDHALKKGKEHAGINGHRTTDIAERDNLHWAGRSIAAEQPHGVAAGLHAGPLNAAQVERAATLGHFTAAGPVITDCTADALGHLFGLGQGGFVHQFAQVAAR